VTFAVVPAAGLSARMGRPKLGLPLGESTVLARVVQSLRGGGVDVVLVVAGPHVPELIAISESAGAQTLHLDSATADMRATVQAGLDWIEEKHHPKSDDLWMLCPGDCPTISNSTVDRLLRTVSNTIVVPTVDGRRGHPVRFLWGHVAGIAALPAHLGINSFVQSQPVDEVAVDDAGILVDVDTPADYVRLLPQ
jgi:molybdenum cofactor cytidylyltransferase